jgi:hypothetical protein
VKKLKSYRQFFEDATSTASSTAGMGAVSSAQVGSAPGMTGTTGSGDIGFTMKKEKRKKGKPSEVTDMRDLEPAKDITHLKENLDFSNRMPELNPDIKSIVEDCLTELTDEGFDINMLKYDNSRESVEIDEDESGEFIQEELRISLHTMVNKIWTGNISLRGNFKKEVEEIKTSTLRTQRELDEDEKNLVEMVKVAALRLRDFLDYQSGVFNISWQVVGSAMPYNSERGVNVYVRFTLLNDIKI